MNTNNKALLELMQSIEVRKQTEHRLKATVRHVPKSGPVPWLPCRLVQACDLIDFWTSVRQRVTRVGRCCVLVRSALLHIYEPPQADPLPCAVSSTPSVVSLLNHVYHWSLLLCARRAFVGRCFAVATQSARPLAAMFVAKSQGLRPGALERGRPRTDFRDTLQMSVLLARSENQILVLETLLKRLVQVCVHTQDKRLAKELKLMDFTRLVR
jgi:hypothetical protein